MSWKDRILGFVRKYGVAAKTVAVSVLNVAAPGSAALVGLVESACDKAVAVAHDQWEDEILRLAGNNAAELERLGKLMELLQGDLAKVCDKAFPFADEPDDVEDIVRRALCADPSLGKALRQLDDLTSQFQCVIEQNNRLLEGQDEMRPIVTRLNRVADFFDEMIAAGVKPRDLAHALKNWQDVSQKIQKRDTAGIDSIVLEMRAAAPKAASVCLLEAGAAMAEGDKRTVIKALHNAVRLKPSDVEMAELHRHITQVGGSTPPGREPGPTIAPIPKRPQPGDTLDGFVLEKLLGAGGWGQVFKSGDKAVKVMHPEYSANQLFVDRFCQEIGILYSLPRHPNLVRIEKFGCAKEQHCWYLVMEYLDGPTLEQYLSSNGPLGEKQLRAYFEPLIEGLMKAHQAGIVHRDIKPGNMIFRKSDGKLVLVDYGLAVAAQDIGHTEVGGRTIFFAAPEVLRGEKATACSDVYSLAATMNYALFHNQPELRVPHGFDPVQVPAGLRNVLAKGIKENPRLRYASAVHLHAELTPAVELEVVEEVPVPKSESPAQRKRRLEADAAKLTDKAKALVKAGDFEKAVKTLEDFRPELLSFRDNALLQNLTRDRDTLRDLQKKIYNERLDQHKYTDPMLPFLIDQFLKIKPNDPEKLELAKDYPPPKAGSIVANPLGMKFSFVLPGTFWMGGGGGQLGTKQVTIDKPFYMGVYPVTQGEWQTIMGNNPSYFSRSGGGAGNISGISDADLQWHPVEQVSWDDAQEFIKRLNQRLKESGWVYRLPTEAEWEYSCRGGPTSPEECKFHYYFDKSANDLNTSLANFNESKLGRTSKVGVYKPNRLGIYDMHGNVGEWCQDLHEAGASYRVFRGGSWRRSAGSAQASYRRWDGPAYRDDSLGFRLLAVPLGF